MAGLLANPKRGIYKITERGLETVRKNPPLINLKFLYQFPEYVAFRKTHRERPESTDEAENGQAGTPEEGLESAHEKMRESWAAEVLQQLKSCSPSFFERLGVEVIVKRGNGGTRKH